MAEIWTPTEFQKRLMEYGYSLPQYGADGYWGDETDAACQRWFRDGIDLAGEIPVPPSEVIVPPEWMPACKMTKIIVHWTAGSYVVSSTDREHYHIIVGGDGKLVRGDNPISDNVNTADGDYAAHTKNCNTGSIGISAACMAGAVESPFNPGSYPLLRTQWDVLVAVAADLSSEYGIPVSRNTILQHGEVQANLGIAQSGKWDINKLPWDVSANAGDQFRSLVHKSLQQVRR